MGPNRGRSPRSPTEASVKSGVPPPQVGQRYLFGPMSQKINVRPATSEVESRPPWRLLADTDRSRLCGQAGGASEETVTQIRRRVPAAPARSVTVRHP